MAKTTWRFEFIDINKSVTINEEESVWTGYAVIRAPKGSTKPMYIPKGNPKMIETMFGYASADWPDIYEILDFNNEYGLWVSAPSGEGKERANVYGGAYLTKFGILPTYRISDKKKPNFEIGLLPGKEKSLLDFAANSKITLDALNNPGEQAVIRITGVSPKVFQKTNYIDFNWGSKGLFRYKINKTDGFLYPDVSYLKVNNDISSGRICGSYKLNTATNLYDFVIGGKEDDQYTISGVVSAGSCNTAEDEANYGIPFIDFNSSSYKSSSVYHYKKYMDLSESENVADWKAVSPDDHDAIYNSIVNGGTVYLSNGQKLTFDSEKSIVNAFRLVFSVADNVYSYHIQPSATANTTKIKFDSIVYDKYLYNRRLYYTGISLPSPTENALAFSKTLTDDGNLVLQVDASNDVRVMQYVEEEVEVEEEVKTTDENGEEITDIETVVKTVGKWVDVTSEYETDAILAFEPLESTKNGAVHHKIFRVADGALTEMTLDAAEDDFVLKENPLYNSYHSIATEEDSEGEIHVSGDFTGSLDEFGTDTNGGDIYWEELVPPDDSVVFAETYVLKTFDKDLDENGIFTGTRVAESAGDEVIISVSGQRYMDYLTEKNIAEGNTGGAASTASASMQKKFVKALRDGWIEGVKPNYEDSSIFMEFTGLDGLKAYFPSIRAAHITSTIISPKNITDIEFQNMRKAKVSNRLRGSAQFCQELQYKDKNLRKKYYSCPIGAIGVMLMRIMEGYLGGKAPAWLNEGSIGGQLEDCMLRYPIKAKWDFEDIDTKYMDEKGINPILMDVDDGVMITSQKTTELNAGDWSFLSNSMAFDLCKREIRDQVMKPQLMKSINPHYINKRQSQVDSILAKRTTGSDPIWAYAASDIKAANTEYTKSQNLFLIPVEVRVFPKSEKVRLSFTNLSQITTVSD